MHPSRLILSLLVLMVPVTASAKPFPIKAPRPGIADFTKALRASRAVDRTQIPLLATNRAAARTVVRGDMIHEVAKVIANVDYDTFVKRMDPADWSLNLPQRWGGEVARMRDTRQASRGGVGAVLQQERMTLGIPALDMTKNTVVTVGKDRATIRWQVTHSDATLLTLGRRTVLADNGSISFSRTADNKVEITTRSAHKVTTLPSLPIERLAPRLASALMAASLRGYFKSTVQRYKEIAEGQRPARRLADLGASLR